MTEIPTAFLYLGCWFLMAGAVYYFLGMETRGKSIEDIDRELNATVTPVVPEVGAKRMA
jgi:putative MFS transporter